MKQIIAGLMFAFAFFGVCAGGLGTDAVGQAGFNSLTESQKAEVIKSIADAKARGDAASDTLAASAKQAVSNPQQVGEWLDVGTKIGQMFGGAAKEVGIAVNEFVKTPVGQWTMAIIIWKYMGNVIVHMFGGILVMAVGLSVVGVMLRRYTTRTIIYSKEKTNWRGAPLITSDQRESMDGDAVASFVAVSLGVIAIGVIVMFTY